MALATQKFTQDFKTVSKDSKIGKAHPDLVGKKRESLELEIPALTVENLSEYSDFVVRAANLAIVNHAKDLLAAKATDWDYTPSSEELTPEAIIKAWDTVTTRQRAITKETLAAFASFYETVAVEKLGKSAAAAATGAKVINSKLQVILSKPDACEVFQGNLLAIMEAVSEEALAPHMPVLQYLIDTLTANTEEIDADAL